MTLPLMPKATAVWLVDNTSLTFEQIADFCGMHVLEIKGIADGEVAIGIIGKDPIASKQLTRTEIELCEKSPSRAIKLSEATQIYIEAKKKKKKSRYTPVARRQDKPDAIAWLVKHYSAILDTQIIRLIGTTKNTIESIRDKSHWNWANLNPRDPVLLGLCSQSDLNVIINKLQKEEEQKIKAQEILESSEQE